MDLNCDIVICVNVSVNGCLHRCVFYNHIIKSMFLSSIKAGFFICIWIQILWNWVGLRICSKDIKDMLKHLQQICAVFM